MPLDDFSARGRHLSDDDPAEGEPLELDDETYGAVDDDDTGEFVDDEDEESEEQLPPGVHVKKGELGEEAEKEEVEAGREEV